MVLTFEDGKIIAIDLNLSAKVPSINKEEFDLIAEGKIVQYLDLCCERICICSLEI